MRVVGHRRFARPRRRLDAPVVVGCRRLLGRHCLLSGLALIIDRSRQSEAVFRVRVVGHRRFAGTRRMIAAAGLIGCLGLIGRHRLLGGLALVIDGRR